MITNPLAAYHHQICFMTEFPGLKRMERLQTHRYRDRFKTRISIRNKILSHETLGKIQHLKKVLKLSLASFRLLNQRRRVESTYWWPLSSFRSSFSPNVMAMEISEGVGISCKPAARRTAVIQLERIPAVTADRVHLRSSQACNRNQRCQHACNELSFSVTYIGQLSPWSRLALLKTRQVT